jgi:hypothetical protein
MQQQSSTLVEAANRLTAGLQPDFEALRHQKPQELRTNCLGDCPLFTRNQVEGIAGHLHRIPPAGAADPL